VSRRRPWPIAAYLGVLVLLFAVTAALGLMYSTSAADHVARVDALADASYGADQAAAGLASAVGQLQTQVARTASTPGLAAALSHPGCALAFGGAGPFTTGHLDLLRPDGSVACTSTAGSQLGTYAGASWLKGALSAPALVGPVRDALTGESVLVALAPIGGGGEVAAFVNLTSLGAGLGAQYGGTRHLELLVTTADGSHSLARSIRPEAWVDAPLTGTPFTALTRPNTATRRDVEGHWRLYGAATVVGPGWRVYAGADRSVALSETAQLRRAMLAIILGAFAIVLLATLVVSRRIAVPIRKLRDAVRRGTAQPGASDTVDLPVQVGGPAEVATLATDFNALLVAMQRELGWRCEAEVAAHASERSYRLLFDDSPQSMWVYDQETLRFLAVNDAALHRYGYSREEFLASTIRDIRPREDVAAVTSSARQILAYEQSGPWRHLKKDGTVIDVEVNSHVVHFEGRPARFVMSEDVTARLASEAQLRRLAVSDSLTGLANRTLVLDRLAHALGRARRRGTLVAALVLDVDRFKVVNDAHGQDIGDDILRTLAGRLTELVGPGDTVGRLSGTEFAIICEDLRDATEGPAMAERIQGVLTSPIPVGQVAGQAVGHAEEVFLSASVGVGLSRGGRTPQELLRDATSATHLAKELGGARYEVFDDAIRTRTLARLDLEVALRRAVDNQELRLHYQPELDLASGRCVGVEALMRWHHPTRGMILPAEFIPLAEETGLIDGLGRWALHTGCHQAARWQKEGAGLGMMSINLSAVQLRQPDLVSQVTEALDQSGLDPTLLCLELTESALMHDADAALCVFSALRALGVRLSIDDFGTGYSSLLYLRRYAVNFIKIDRAFVNGVDTNPEDEAIVGGVIGLGHAFGLTVIAEGVETRDQETKLRTMGCDLAQGFLWAPGVEPARLPETVQRLEAAFARQGVRGGA
jgi:diguanylate cyclase (GGDEF)-like protein/PAS domain S-box-containing protein